MARIGVGLPRPVAVFVDGAADVELRIQTVGSLHVHGLIGIDTACGVVAYGLGRAAMIVGKRGTDVHRLLMSVSVLVEVVNVGICDHVALQAGIALSDYERLAVIAPPDAVHQLCRAAVVACAEAEVVLAVLAHQPGRGRGVQEYGVLRGHRVYHAPLVVEPFVAHGQAQGNIPPLILHRHRQVGIGFALGRLVERHASGILKHAAMAVVGVRGVGNGCQHVYLRRQQQRVGVVEVVVRPSVHYLGLFYNAHPYVLAERHPVAEVDEAYRLAVVDVTGVVRQLPRIRGELLRQVAARLLAFVVVVRKREVVVQMLLVLAHVDGTAYVGLHVPDLALAHAYCAFRGGQRIVPLVE